LANALKSQAPNPKSQGNSKHQIPNNNERSRNDITPLELEYWSFFGAWDLELSAVIP
jgi:hypothetical protein